MNFTNKVLAVTTISLFSLASQAEVLKKLQCQSSKYKATVTVAEDKDEAATVEWIVKTKGSKDRPEDYMGYLFTGESHNLTEFSSTDDGSDIEVKNNTVTLKLNAGFDDEHTETLECK